MKEKEPKLRSKKDPSMSSNSSTPIELLSALKVAQHFLQKKRDKLELKLECFLWTQA
jgi:hypothetical protein